MKPVIVAVGYNRPALMKRLLDSVGRASYDCDDVHLIVSIDESNRSDEVEQVAREFQWNHGTKEIRRFPERQGLRKHIVQCGDYSEKYGAVIILEDDLVVSEDFYSYVCQAHEKYSDDERICGVALYSYKRIQFTGYRFDPVSTPYDAFLGGMVVTWGQSWTAKQWGSFKSWYLAHEDKLPAVNHAIPEEISSWNRSWGKYFASYMAETGRYYIYPYAAHTTCFAELGEHSVNAIPLTCVQVPLMTGRKKYVFGDYEQLPRYDSFYERVLDDSVNIHGIPGSQICMDLGGMKHNTLGKKYVITGSELPHQRLASFALAMKPAEMNVLRDLPGTAFNLYELSQPAEDIRPPKKKPYAYELNHMRLRYEHVDMPLRSSIYYSLHELWLRLRIKLKLK